MASCQGEATDRTVRMNGDKFLLWVFTASFGHLTMAHLELWLQPVGEFMRWLGDAPQQVNAAR